MKLKINVAELSSAVSSALKFTDSNNSVYSAVWLEAKKDGLIVSAFNADLSFKAERQVLAVFECGLVGVNGPLLGKVLKSLGGGEATLTLESGALIVQMSGKKYRFAEIATQWRSPLPEVELSTYSVEGQDFSHVLQLALPFTGPDYEDRKSLIFLHPTEDGVRVVATDEHNLVRINSDSLSYIDSNLLIHRKYAAAIIKWLPPGDIYLGWNDKLMIIESVAYRETLYIPLSQYQYYDYPAFFAYERDAQGTLHLNLDDFKQAVYRASLLSEQFNKQLMLEISESTVTLSRASDQGTFREELPLLSVYDGVLKELNFSDKILLRVVEKLSGTDLHMTVVSGERPVYLRCDGEPGITILTMPMIIQEASHYEEEANNA